MIHSIIQKNGNNFVMLTFRSMYGYGSMQARQSHRPKPEKAPNLFYNIRLVHKPKYENISNILKRRLLETWNVPARVTINNDSMSVRIRLRVHDDDWTMTITGDSG